jgi:hypothetical protein
MKREVEELLAKQTLDRRELLQGLSADQRVALLEQLINDFFGAQRAVLLRWATLTGQSAQIDTGYIAQHMASVVLGEPGQGFKGKGVDLADGSEVKSASIVSGVDRPRWNHNLGTLADDEDRERRRLDPKWKAYLDAPSLFYVLFDRVFEDGVEPEKMRSLRVRAWCLDAQKDADWRDLVERFVGERSGNTYNLQLHPPVGYDDDVVVNMLGNLDFSRVKVLEARFVVPEDPTEDLAIEWTQPPPDEPGPGTGRTKALPWEGRGSRPSRLEGASGHEFAGMTDLANLFPSLDMAEAIAAADSESLVDPEADDASEGAIEPEA